MKEVADLIEKAVEVIDAEGWTQGTLHIGDAEGSSSVPHCMLGGLLKAATGKNSLMAGPEYLAASELLAERASLGNIPDYNDAPGRTWGECRDVMLSVVKDLRNKGER